MRSTEPEPVRLKYELVNKRGVELSLS